MTEAASSTPSLNPERPIEPKPSSSLTRMPRLSRITRKRLSWIGALLTLRGDVHYERWGGHAWKADHADQEDRRSRHGG
jgi:hypothetical protein